MDGTASRHEREWRWLIVALSIGVGMVVALPRRPTGFQAPAFYAEDGAVFFHDQVMRGFSPFDPYAGQLWLLQRVVTALTTVPDPITTARVFYLASVVIATLALASVLSNRFAPLLGSLPWRIVAFALLVLLPGVEEVHGNLANLHVWAALVAMLWLTAPAPMRTWTRCLEVGFIALVCLSGFSALVLLPASIWGLLRYRDNYAKLRLAVVVLGAAIAVTTWLVSGRAVNPSGSALEKLAIGLQAIPSRVGGTLLAGESHPPTGPLLILPFIVLLIAVGVSVFTTYRPAWAWLLCGLAWLCLGAVSLPWVEAQVALVTPYWVDRYFTVLLAATALALVRGVSGVDQVPGSTVTVAIRAICAIALAMIVVGILRDYRLWAYTPLNPTAAEQFVTCTQSGQSDCAIPVWPIGWTPRPGS